MIVSILACRNGRNPQHGVLTFCKATFWGSISCKVSWIKFAKSKAMIKKGFMTSLILPSIYEPNIDFTPLLYKKKNYADQSFAEFFVFLWLCNKDITHFCLAQLQFRLQLSLL